MQVVNTPDANGETVLPLAREVIRESLAFDSTIIRLLVVEFEPSWLGYHNDKN